MEQYLKSEIKRENEHFNKINFNEGNNQQNFIHKHAISEFK